MGDSPRDRWYKTIIRYYVAGEIDIPLPLTDSISNAASALLHLYPTLEPSVDYNVDPVTYHFVYFVIHAFFPLDTEPVVPLPEYPEPPLEPQTEPLLNVEYFGPNNFLLYY